MAWLRGRRQSRVGAFNTSEPPTQLQAPDVSDPEHYFLEFLPILGDVGDSAVVLALGGLGVARGASVTGLSR